MTHFNFFGHVDLNLCAAVMLDGEDDRLTAIGDIKNSLSCDLRYRFDGLPGSHHS
jgi:hypothetical protein